MSITPHWPRRRHAGGSCLRCSFPIPWQYDCSRVRLQVKGEQLSYEAEVILMLLKWSGCPVDEPSALEQFSFEDMQDGPKSFVNDE